MGRKDQRNSISDKDWASLQKRARSANQDTFSAKAAERRKSSEQQRRKAEEN